MLERIKHKTQEFFSFSNLNLFRCLLSVVTMSKSAGSDALSNEYIMWAIDAYDDKRLRWRDMDDATMALLNMSCRRGIE